MMPIIMGIEASAMASAMGFGPSAIIVDGHGSSRRSSIKIYLWAPHPPFRQSVDLANLSSQSQKVIVIRLAFVYMYNYNHLELSLDSASLINPF